MPNIETGCIIIKKIQPIFFLVEKTLNSEKRVKMEWFVSSIIDKLMENSYCSPYAEDKIIIYTFSQQSQCHFDSLQKLDEIDLRKIFNNRNVDITELLQQLNTDLSRKTLMRDKVGYMAPFIILLVDGDSNYIDSEELEHIKTTNRWFQISRKLALCMDMPNADTYTFLTKFTGSEEAIMTTDNENLFDVFQIMRYFLHVSIGPGDILAPYSLTPDDENIVRVDPIVDSGEIDSVWDDDDTW